MFVNVALLDVALRRRMFQVKVLCTQTGACCYLHIVIAFDLPQNRHSGQACLYILARPRPTTPPFRQSWRCATCQTAQARQYVVRCQQGRPQTCAFLTSCFFLLMWNSLYQDQPASIHVRQLEQCGLVDTLWRSLILLVLRQHTNWLREKHLDSRVPFSDDMGRL